MGLLKADPAPCPTPTSTLILTFCNASLSGLPCVKAKMGSLATFREEVCFHRSLGAHMEKRGRQVSGDQQRSSPSVSNRGSWDDPGP